MSEPIIRTKLADWSQLTQAGTVDLIDHVCRMIGDDADNRYDLQRLVPAFADALTEVMPAELELELGDNGELRGPEGTNLQDAIAAVRQAINAVDFHGILAPQYELQEDGQPTGLVGFAPIDPDQGGATILSMNALDLLHRTAVNRNGAEFHIDRLEFEARSGTITIWMTELDEDGDLTDNQVGVATLSGWAIL